MFTVNQLNNKYNLSKDDILQMENIYRTIAHSFSGPMNTEDFKDVEMEHYTDTRGSTQFFYLTAPNGDIASVTEIVPRKGNHEDSLNLLVTMVFTNPNYRKMGLIGKLINFIINFYESDGDFEISNKASSLLISDSIKGKDCQNYINSIIPQKLRETKKIHWSLYSIINDFYKQFGFTPCDDINWLEIKYNDVLANSQHGFNVNSKTEKLLTMNDLKQYYFNDEYSLPMINDENLLNCSQEESSYPGFVERIQSYVKKHQDEVSVNEFFQICGVLIKDDDCETIILVCPFFFINRVIVNRVFTSAPNTEILKKHWQRAIQFIYNYAEKQWSLGCLKEIEPERKTIMVADNDFVSRNGNISKQEFSDMVTNTTGWKNTGTGLVLPMIRDWKEHKTEPSKLAHNGFWSFM